MWILKKKYILIIFVDFYVSLSQFFFATWIRIHVSWSEFGSGSQESWVFASVVMLILFCPILFWMSLIPWLSQFKQNGIVKIVNYHNFCANCQLQNPLLKSLVSIASFYQNSENLIFMEIMFINNCAIWKEYETKLNS